MYVIWVPGGICLMYFYATGFVCIVSVRIRVRIDPPHPLVCRKRRLNGGDPSDETGKTKVPCVNRPSVTR
jgi:hypothetical protein